MIVRIRGRLEEVTEDSALLDRDGILREILVPRFSIPELASCRGQTVTLYTMEFFDGNLSNGPAVPRMVGFLQPEDRLFFVSFTQVKGIGTRKALKALAEPVSRISGWIESADAASLSRLPGIGKRASELIIAQLRGKVASFAVGEVAVAGETATEPLTQVQRDALEVLVAWGDPRNDATRWLVRAMEMHPDVSSADELVRHVYRMRAGAAVGS